MFSKSQVENDLSDVHFRLISLSFSLNMIVLVATWTAFFSDDDWLQSL